MRTLSLFLFAVLTTHATFAFTPDEDGIYAVFDTSMGEFTTKIAYDKVPLTAGNFIGLAEGTIPRFDPQTGEFIEITPFYDGLIFHRVLKDFVIQAGDPEIDNEQISGPGYVIPIEIHPELSHNPDYSLSMANDSTRIVGAVENGEYTTGSQFLITAAALPGQPPVGLDLNGRYSVFGRAVDGFDVIDAILLVDVEVSTRRPIDDVTINSVTILRVGEDAEAFDVADQELALPSKLSPLDLTVNPDSDGVSFEFQADPGAEYEIQTSSNLADWDEGTLLSYTNSVTSHSIQIDSPDKVYVRALPLKIWNLAPDVRDGLPGMTFTAFMESTFPAEDWVFEFSEEGAGGTIHLPEYEDTSYVIDFYQYYRLPNGGRLKISSSAMQHELFIDFKYTDENSGTIFVWLDDYVQGNPLHYSTPGTFELTETP